MSYPTTKDLSQKTEDFVRTLRQYARGLTTKHVVKHELTCLMTTIALDEQKDQKDIDAQKVSEALMQ